MHRSCRIAALALGLVVIAACGLQKPAQPAVTVPESVQLSFRAKFPNVPEPEWKLKADRNYEAEFTVQDVERAVKFDPAGKWLETETAIQLSAVPKPVLNTAAVQFKDYQIIETQSLQRAAAQPLTYELHLDNGKQIVKAEFSAEGAILSQSAKPK